MLTFSQFTRPIVIAHRGASAATPENTLSAFNKAIELVADAVEFDVKLTGDKRVVVMHDRTVDRTTDGRGEVKRLSLRQITQLDAGIKFSPNYVGEKVPLLEEVCESLRDQILLNIELTNYGSSYDELPSKVAEIVTHYRVASQVLISSFNPFNLIRYHRCEPGTALALLIEPKLWSKIFGLIFSKKFAISTIHPYYTQINQRNMEIYRHNFDRINSWTINKVEDMEDLLNHGVDGIITDYPEIARGLIIKKGISD